MTTPSLAEVIRRAVRKAVLALHTAMPGKVVSYNATANTADVQPLVKWQDFLPGQLRSVFEMPVLPDVLVCHPRSSGRGMHLPLAAGDLVLLIFCSRSLVGWRSGSATRVADPGRAFTPTPLDAAIAIPLMTHDSAPLAGGIVAGDTVNIGAATGGTFDFPALAARVLSELQSFRTQFNGHAHSETGTTTGIPTVPMTAPSSVAAQHVKVS
jgi:hypothetical protein